MKKLTGAMLLCAVLLCAGCSDNGQGPASIDNNAVNSETGGSTNSSAADEESSGGSDLTDISYTKLLPDWEQYFPDGEINVIDSDGGTSYTFQVSGVTGEQRDAYIEACCELDFKHGPQVWNTAGMEEFLTNPEADDVGANTWEVGTVKHYEAYSGDKLYVFISDYHTDEEYITITCRYKGKI